jgi:uncharacterized membrane protein HdeD (DUF308 family)
MTAPVGSTGTADTTIVKVPGALRWALLIVGLLAAVLGVVMILNPFTTAKVLAIIIGLELIISGVVDLLDHRYRSKVLSVIAGLTGIVAGVLAIAWPGVTLWVLAIIVGLGFIIRGTAQVAAGFSTEAKLEGMQGLLVAVGAISIVAGMVALVWPKATIVVLAVLFGIRVVAVGVLQLGAGWLLGKVELEVDT